MNKKPLLPVLLPKVDTPIFAVIKHIEKQEVVAVKLISVDEDDCSYRFISDNCQLAYDYDVVYWEYL